MHCLSRYEALGNFRESSKKVAKRLPIFWNSTRESRKFACSRRVFDVKGGAVYSKNSKFGFFDGTAWTTSLRSPTPIMAPGSSLYYSLSFWQETRRLFFFMYSFLIRQCYCDGTISLLIQPFFVSEKVLHSGLKYDDKLITVVFLTECGC